jgi:hypothetical protein
MARLTLADEIFELHRKLLAELPPGTAALTRRPSSDPAGGEDIDLTPANPNSARISHHPLGDIIYSEIGRHTIMEFWVGSRKREQQEFENMRRISRAVIDGKFSEDVWTVNDKIVKSRATIEVDGKMEEIGLSSHYSIRCAGSKESTSSMRRSSCRSVGNPETTLCSNL